MPPLYNLNYAIDKQYLLEKSIQLKQKATSFTDPRYPSLKMDNWLIHYYNDDYIEKIINDFDLPGSARFYWLKPFAEIPEHVDYITKCGLNFILTDNPSPITYNSINYYYRSALIDTSKPHSVKNNEFERVMLKISISEYSFEETVNKIKKFIL